MNIISLNHLHDADDDVLQPRPVRVVVEDEGSVLGSLRTSEGRRSHARVQGAEMIMESVKVLRKNKGTLDCRAS